MALKVVNGALQPGWISRDISSPLAPIVVKGLVFTGGAPKGSLSEQYATLYVQTADNTLWSLGFPQNKEDYAAVIH